MKLQDFHVELASWANAGQREALRGTDATVAIARAAGRPQVAGTIGVNRDLTRSGVLNSIHSTKLEAVCVR